MEKNAEQLAAEQAATDQAVADKAAADTAAAEKVVADLTTERDTLKTERGALKAELDRLEKLTGKAAKPPTGGGKKQERWPIHVSPALRGGGPDQRL